MNNKPETSADIEAELRELSMSAKSASAKYGEYRPTVYGKPIALYFAKLADRLKAARKREKAAIEADALAVGGMVEAARTTTEKSSAVGDCAKLREALQQAKVAILAARKKMGVDNPIILEIIDAALAAPLRNCEVGTEQEQAWRFLKYCVKQDCEKACPFRDCKNSYECAFGWAQMPYEEGEEKCQK